VSRSRPNAVLACGMRDVPANHLRVQRPIVATSESAPDAPSRGREHGEHSPHSLLTTLPSLLGSIGSRGINTLDSSI
jgi:hypothetical protein